MDLIPETGVMDFGLYRALHADVTERMVYRIFYLGRNFVSGLICTLKSKNLKT